ncbi:MAG: cytochrome, partial [Desulfomicrobiaceae bacterium]|nr:cytochrome [Desulfomicrobiaceae bacterium]
MRWVLLGLVLVGLTLPALAQENRYVGSQACADCHEAQYASYKANSKKAHSSRTVQQMASDLTEEELKSCFA